VFGKPGDDPALLRIDDEKSGRIEIRGGWATGHEAVTLVEPLIMTVGEERHQDSHRNDDTEGDDAYEDDQAEADHEEQLIEEERQIVDSEIEKVEKDVIEALEEKRLEIPDNEPSDINAAEEEVFQVLEDQRKDMNKALNSIKDEIIIEKAAHVKQHEAQMREMHRTDKERREMRRIHAEEMAKKHRGAEEQMDRITKHLDPRDPRRQRFEHFQTMRENFRDNQDVIAAIDKAEHDHAQQNIPQQQLDMDLENVKRTVHEHMMEQHRQQLDQIQRDNAPNIEREKQKFHEVHDKMQKDMYNMQRSGVHETIRNRDVKILTDKVKTHAHKLQGHLQKGLPRGGEAYHGEVGRPLSSEARNGLLGLFAVVGAVGLVRWGLDKRRRGRKGHLA
jgi:hypothetical protein